MSAVRAHISPTTLEDKAALARTLGRNRSPANLLSLAKQAHWNVKKGCANYRDQEGLARTERFGDPETVDQFTFV